MFLIFLFLLLLIFNINPIHYFVSQNCYNTCGKKVCDNYRTKKYNYYECKNCKSIGKCWSPNNGACIKCSEQELKVSCKSQSKFGCQNPYSYMLPDVEPINPIYTNCKLCNTE